MMRILVVGAGAIGGYFGGRLIDKGEDVTFLVREKRKQQLDQFGLIIESIHGNLQIQPKTLLSGQSADPFDVILLSTKAYHLQGAIKSVKPYVSENTMILPLLNGIAHINELKSAFGEKAVIGGLCSVETTLSENGKVLQTSSMHDFIFGEFTGETTDRILRLQEAFSRTKANFHLTQKIDQAMWHKYLFISTLSGVTTLFRSPIGPIRDQKLGIQTIQKLLREVGTVMRSIQAPLAENIEVVQCEKIEQLGYKMKSSLQRDMEKGLKTEADHFFGFLLEIAEKQQLSTPLIRTIYANLKIYESQI